MSSLPVIPSPCPAGRYPRQTSASVADVTTWLSTCLSRQPVAQQLRALWPLWDAHFSGADRLALHAHLWTLWPQVDVQTQQQVLLSLDGRWQGIGRWLARPWSDPLAWLPLAYAHLPNVGAGAAPLWPSDPAYVLALLASHGVEEGSVPVSLSADMAAHARWLQTRAAWLSVASDVLLTPDQCQRIEAGVLAAVQAQVLTWSQGMVLLLEAQVQAGDWVQATQVLTQILAAGHGQTVPPKVLLRWLEGAEPLRLSAALEAQWLQRAQWGTRGWWQRLLKCVHREDVRERVTHGLAVLAGTAPAEVVDDVPDNDGWRLLSSLDTCYVLAQQGRLPEQAAELLIQSHALAESAQAALRRCLALQAMDAQDLALASDHLAEARRVCADPRAAQWLAAVVTALNRTQPTPQAQHLIDVLNQPGSGVAGDADGPEALAWEAVAQETATPAVLRSIAQVMMGRLWSHGCLSAAAVSKRRQLHNARALWQALAERAATQAVAQRFLQQEPLRSWWPVLHQSAQGCEYLWVSPAQGVQANGQVLIVLSCLESRADFAQFQGLVRELPQHHMLFLNNPEFNWYSEAAFDAVVAVVQAQVLSRFDRHQVTCYFGSMGGYGALKLALHLGLRAVVFNPQVDLDLWAAYRPLERQRLGQAAADDTQAGLGVLDRPLHQWAQAPICYLVGSWSADRQALSLWLERVRQAPRAQIIVEKFADPHHAGMIRRVVQGRIGHTVAAAAQRLAELRALQPTAAEEGGDSGWRCVEPAAQALFWRELDQASSRKVEVLLREGQLWVAPSVHCLTR